MVLTRPEIAKSVSRNPKCPVRGSSLCVSVAIGVLPTQPWFVDKVLAAHSVQPSGLALWNQPTRRLARARCEWEKVASCGCDTARQLFLSAW
jgi:hypothetical protein